MDNNQKINDIKTEIRELVNKNKKIGMEFERTAIIMFGPARFSYTQMGDAVQNIDSLNEQQFENNKRIGQLCSDLMEMYAKTKVLDIKQ